MDEKEIIARRAAKELRDGWIVNLGIGLPTLIANYIPDNVEVILQSENGIMGMDSMPEPGQEDKYITNAGGVHVTVQKGAAFFDSCVSFGIIRGGHLDVTVLGVLEVDSFGNLASHIIPGKLVPGMGGAMDLVTGAKKVIVATTHTAKGGVPKILERCTLPLTAAKKVDMIITELAVIKVAPQGLVVLEIAEGLSFEELQDKTGARLQAADDLKIMQIG